MAIGTFGSFTQARLAIYAAQTGLNVTGNNISNINTPGYTRQRLNQVSLYAAGSDRYYAEGDIRVGQGALVKSISQIRSPYLDVRYRTEQAKVGYMDAKLEGLDEIAQILDEVGKGDESKGEGGFGVLGLEFNKIAAALKDLVSQTGHQEYDDTVRQTAKNLIQKLNSYANRLEEVRQDTVKKLDQDLSEINNYLTTIRSLNEEIRKGDIHGDAGLELRDERNRQIDALSELIDINVVYSEEEIAPGMMVEKLTITLDDANPDKTVTTDESLLVDGVFSAQLSFGTPALNTNPDTKDDFPYLNIEKDKDGNVIAETPVADILDATILTDEENPNYSVLISQLTNKIGEPYVGSKPYAAKTIAEADVPADILGKFTDRKYQLATTEKDKPDEGDETVTIYTRTHLKNKDGTLTKPPQYSYSSQVYERIVSRPVALDDNDINGKLQAHRELLTEEGEFTDLDVIANIDEGAGGKRGIPYYQKTLDLLANQFAKVMNEANQGYLTDTEGNYIKKETVNGKDVGVAIELASGNKLNKNTTWDKLDPADQAELEGAGVAYDATANGGTGNLKEVMDAYLKANGGLFRGGVLFSNNPGNDDPTGITAANISISNTWDKTHLLVRSYTCVDGDLEPASGQSDNILHMEYLVGTQKFDYVPTQLDSSPNASTKPMFNGTFYEMFNNIGTVLGEDQDYTGTMLTTYYESALAIDTQRDSVSSVDFNDEAMNLMMYAKSYNAACRLMTTIDSVLDKLINNTGLTT